MIDLSNVKHVYIAAGFTDLRKGIDGYAAIVDGNLNLNLSENSIFIFCNKFRNKIKILHLENGSCWLYYKRIEHFTLKWPSKTAGIEIRREHVKGLLNGLKLEKYVKNGIFSRGKGLIFLSKNGIIYIYKELFLCKKYNQHVTFT